jgi:SNF2 family DNA or RNA helicase
VRYDGDTPKDKIQEIQMDFDRRTAGEHPKWDVVLCHYKKGGVGLNLNAATQTIILDEEWNPGKVDQAYGRTDRLGQTEETTVHVLRVGKSVDVWMAKLIGEKAEMIEGFEVNADMQQKLLDIMRGIDPNYG